MREALQPGDERGRERGQILKGQQRGVSLLLQLAALLGVIKQVFDGEVQALERQHRPLTEQQLFEQRARERATVREERSERRAQMPKLVGDGCFGQTLESLLRGGLDALFEHSVQQFTFVSEVFAQRTQSNSRIFGDASQLCALEAARREVATCGLHNPCTDDPVLWNDASKAQ